MAAKGDDHDCKYRRRVEELEAQVEAQAAQVEAQAAQLAALQRQVFGRKSEKLPPVEPQLRPKRLPNDAGAQAVRAERRRKQMELVGNVTIHEGPESQRTCPNCEHEKLKTVKGRTTTTFDYVPGFLVREEHVQEVLACTSCDYIVRADAPSKVFERARYGSGLMAHVVTQKCADSMPIYRLEKQFKRLDVPIRRSTLTQLFHRAAEELAPVSKRLREKVAEATVVQADETPLKVQKRKKRGYMWTFVAEDQDVAGDLVSYAFSPDRSGQTPSEILGGTTGTLVVDAYTGYNAVTDVDGRDRAGCMAHLRRKFFEARSSAPKADQAMAIMLDAYRVEHEARQRGVVGTEEHLEMRNTRSRDAMRRLRDWLTVQKDQHPPKSLIGRAIAHADNNWDALTRFVEDAKIPIDNNASERALRRVALGRKNFLFVGHDEAGRNLAGLYSLVATCEANDVNPEAYLAIWRTCSCGSINIPRPTSTTCCRIAGRRRTRRPQNGCLEQSAERFSTRRCSDGYEIGADRSWIRRSRRCDPGQDQAVTVDRIMRQDEHPSTRAARSTSERSTAHATITGCLENSSSSRCQVPSATFHKALLRSSPIARALQ